MQRPTAREHEAIHLYELIMHLAGLQDEQEIVSTLAEQTLIALRAGRVDVLVEAQGNIPAHHVRMEDRSQPDQQFGRNPHLSSSIAVHAWLSGRDQGLA